jgi:hypothetical protein
MTRASGKTDIPEMNEFLQKTHPQLKVVDVEGKGNKRKFILVCDVCSKDEELWPYGSIRQSKSSLLGGSLSCGCGVPEGAVNPTSDFFPDGFTEAVLYSKEAERNLIALATELFNR